MKLFITSASILTLFVGLSSCEKHEWDKTKKLYESHDEAGHDDHGHDDHGHAAAEAGHDDHSDHGHSDKH